LVLHEEGTAFGGVIEEPLVGAGKVGAQLVGAHADYDGVKFGEVTEGESLRIQKVHLNAKHAQSIGDGFAFGGDVSHAEILRHVDGKGVNDAARGLRQSNVGIVESGSRKA